eukprot:gnl/TRDRNA2_/TRDRNA2_132961_c0_seq1.p1 gnl/TRDRNA2_/TRDRNA2_132961_c0~~gnl/TRDRNA2_/TRDRNA2_132961_c0_seq1.p1  ORF type:complete len:332 (-),score=51.19 gnl/TRDRNA2_/TRDRNA2_132961_c0_seq1:54-1049(-)
MKKKLPFCTSLEDATDGRWILDQQPKGRQLHSKLAPSDPAAWGPWRCRLAPAVRNPQLQTHLANKKILLFGDSQSTHLTNAFGSRMGCKLKLKVDMPKCLRDDRMAQRHVRAFLGQDFTKLVFGCDIECGGCLMLRYSCPKGLQIWAFVVEFMAQKTIRTSKTATTLEFLFKEWIPKKGIQIVLGNTGLHELTKIAPAHEYNKRGAYYAPYVGKGTGSFVNYANSASKLADTIARWAQKYGGRFIYLLTTDSTDTMNRFKKWDLLTNSYHIKLINDIAGETMKKRNFAVANAFGLSRFHGSLHDLHTDKVHMHKHKDLYYRALATAILTTL